MNKNVFFCMMYILTSQATDAKIDYVNSSLRRLVPPGRLRKKKKYFY